MDDEVRRLLKAAVACATRKASSMSTSGVLHCSVLPNLYVEQIGIISFPVQPNQAAALIEKSIFVSKSHPYEHTANSASFFYREIEMSDFSYCTSWNEAVKEYAMKAAADLSLAPSALELRSSRLLIFEPGATFSSKEFKAITSPAITIMIVQFPSFHNKGALIVSENEREHVLDLHKWSEVKFHWFACRTGCEFRFSPITTGFRICALYEFVHRRSQDFPPPYRQQALDKFSQACDVWEQLPHDGRPIKFLVPLRKNCKIHNTGCVKLTKDDAMLARHLLKCNRFRVVLVLLEKEESNGSGEILMEPRPDDHILSVPGKTKKDEVSVQHQRYKVYRFEDAAASDLSEIRAVRADSNSGEISGLRLEQKDVVEMDSLYVDSLKSGEKHVFQNSEMIQTSCDSDPTTALVLWPKTYEFSVLCQSDFLSAMQFLKSAVLVTGDFATRMLRLALDYLSRSNENLRKYTTILLEFSCHVRSEECVVTALKQMSRIPNSEDLIAPWRKSNFGCSLGRQVRAIGKAISLFEWKVIGPQVKRIVRQTHPNKFMHFLELLESLHENCKLQEAVDDIGTTVMEMVQTTEFSIKNIEALSRLTFSFSCFSNEQSRLLQRMKKLSNTMIVRAIHGVSGALEKRRNYSTIEALKVLLKEYVPRGVVEYCKEEKPLKIRKLYPYIYTTETEALHKPLVSVFAVILRWRDIAGELLRFFVVNVLSANHVGLLRTVVQCESLGSAVNDPNVRRLVRSLLDKLKYRKPKKNNRQPKALVPNHPEINEFFHGDEIVLVYNGFSGVKEARKFINGRFYGRLNKLEGHSAHADVSGRGSEVSVVLRKTAHYYLEELKQYELDQGEVHRLRHLLGSEIHGANRKRQKIY